MEVGKYEMDMKLAFNKLGKYYCYMWLGILFDLLASLMLGFIKKFNNIFTVISRADIYDNIKELIGNNKVFEFISRYTGIGLRIILIFYILILMLYIVIVFGIPNIMYCINKAVIKNYTGTATNIVVWLLCFLSFIPGIWCATKMFVLFTAFLSLNIILIHLAVMFLIQIAMIVIHIVVMFQSRTNKGEQN